jgi:hypothetical protein
MIDRRALRVRTFLLSKLHAIDSREQEQKGTLIDRAGALGSLEQPIRTVTLDSSSFEFMALAWAACCGIAEDAKLGKVGFATAVLLGGGWPQY